MTSKKSDEQQKLDRRIFIQFSATVTGAYAMTMKTDAIAQPAKSGGLGGTNPGAMSYPYS